MHLPFCMGEWSVSSVSCRPGALIFSYSCTGNDCWDVIGPYQCHFDGCKYCFWKNQQKCVIRKRMGAGRGVMQPSNGDGKGQGVGGGHRWVIIYQFCLHVFYNFPLSILFSSVFCLILITHRESWLLGYSWIGHRLQTELTLAFLLWLSDFKTKTRFGFFSPN